MKKLIPLFLLFSTVAFARPAVVWGPNGALVLSKNLCFQDNTCQSTANAGTLTFGLPLLNTAGNVTIHKADASHDGYLSSSDWSMFNAGGAGITALTGDVTATGPGSAAATLAKIQGTTVTGTSGTGNVLFDHNPIPQTDLVPATNSLSLGNNITQWANVFTGNLESVGPLSVSTISSALAGYGISLDSGSSFPITNNTSPASINITAQGANSASGSNSGGAINITGGDANGNTDSTGGVTISSGNVNGSNASSSDITLLVNPPNGTGGSGSIALAGPTSFQGAYYPQVTTISSSDSPYAVAQFSDQSLYVDTSGGAVTVNLPSAPSSIGNGMDLLILDHAGTAATHSVTIATGAGDTFAGGGTSKTISRNFGWLHIQYDASETEWMLVGTDAASAGDITALTGDVTATGPGSVASTVAKIQGTTVSGTSGSGNVAFTTSPSFTTPNLGAATFTTLTSATANPASTGAARLASGDLFSFRSTDNTFDDTIGVANLESGQDGFVFSSSSGGGSGNAVLFLDTPGLAGRGAIFAGGHYSGNSLPSSFAVNGTSFSSGFTFANNSSSNKLALSGVEYSSDASGQVIAFAKARGTSSSPSVVSNGDVLGSIVAVGHDGTDFKEGAQIAFTVGASPGSGSMPGSIIFGTTKSGAVAPTTALTINPTQGSVFAGTVFASINGAANTPAFKAGGTPFTGGTSSSTVPLVLIQNAGTSNNWSTSGTEIGINPANGFSGNLIDAQVNATREFSVSATGTVTGVTFNSNAVQSLLTGSAGNATCSEPEQGVSYKKAFCYLNGYTDTGTQTYTFPTAFSHTPYVYGLAAGVTGTSATTTTVTFTVTTQTGFVFLEGY